ncbi:MAG: AmmeMemoRadiSam system protein B [Patescibacteria group bacterium]
MAPKKSTGENVTSLNAQHPQTVRSTGFFEYTEAIDRVFSETQPASFADQTPVQLGLTSHHLPTAAPLIVRFYVTLQKQLGPRKTFVIVGPDHAERCPQYVTTTALPYQTPSGLLPIDPEVSATVQAAGAVISEGCFVGEHSTSVQAFFIRRSFPDALVVPILLSSATSDESLSRLAQALSAWSDSITVIGSVDFSHALPVDEARQRDAATDQILLQQNVSSLTLDQVDSPPTVKLLYLLNQRLGNKPPVIFDHANTFDFTGAAENTTGYRNIMFFNSK